ncbi:MAG: superoxide dismutase [Chitinophagaceae bacterium]|nr:MAG: superoxide dismutase [Chitinophagaceae bacterium]
MTSFNRRKFIRNGFVASIGSFVGFNLLFSNSSIASINSHHLRYDDLKYPFKLTDLKYGFEAIEPVIDKKTMEIHYKRHHQGYVNNFNNAVKDHNLQDQSLQSILNQISKYGDAMRNNGGGHYNHDLFWKTIKRPDANNKPSSTFTEILSNAFDSFDNFKETFEAAAMQRFGSGWAWLYLDENKHLKVGSSPNQDNPLMDLSPIRGIPILGLDVWEHAYYLQYQNRRADYTKNFWQIVNWQEVEKRYTEITGKGR